MSDLTVNNISFHYPEQEVLLKNVSFEVSSGTSVSILGPSGSGKSTLFYLLAGLYSPTAGGMKLGKHELKNSGMVGYMPQDSSLFPWKTVKENILLGHKLARKKHAFSLDHWLERAGLVQVADSFPHQLSGGMKQRVSFLRALASGHNVICLDEPFASLDALTRTKMQKWLASLMADDQTFLLITHQIEETVLLSDRILLFMNGLQGRPKEIINPFPRPVRFEVRKTSAFWEFVQEIEIQLE
ncbi:ABC transporter ATP-binding protein [Shimazuella sp. AN120528]|uniref:ABC transporter ATP-binding protein n=1 Tax=Shimazuella soli TaxID=1892854 RepID=UPI001F0D7F04|nr:ABC transporter ATP-binding protein [Shimazuella soli]MCH5584167.1 ABC transporter ATP-binding protein [Shimazuella soli]